MKRFPIMDALRFFLAMWVVVGHVGQIPLFGTIDGTNHAEILARAWRMTVWPTTAVIGFFVISGFCIHYPLIGTENLPVTRFYLRRYLRVLAPLAAIIALYKICDPARVILGPRSIVWDSALWSLVCEEAYYAAYPLIRVLRGRFGWPPLLAAASAVSVALAATRFAAVSWYQFGVPQTVLCLLPVWLFGCVLAERIGTMPMLREAWVLWGWRASAWAVMLACQMLHFHLGVHEGQTAFWSGIVMFLWIEAELRFARKRPVSPIIVWAGGWSYSLYLVHPFVLDVVIPSLPLPPAGPLAAWLLKIVLMLAGAYVFYLVVERPSHLLARRISLKSAPHLLAPQPS